MFSFVFWRVKKCENLQWIEWLFGVGWVFLLYLLLLAIVTHGAHMRASQVPKAGSTDSFGMPPLMIGDRSEDGVAAVQLYFENFT